MSTYPNTSNYIGGKAGTGQGPELPVVDPATGTVIWTFRCDDQLTVDAALDAAQDAFPEWSGATPAERSGILLRLAAELEAVGEELAQTETAQTGKPIRLSREFDDPGSVDNVAFFAGAARHLEGGGGVLRRPHFGDPAREPGGGRLHRSVELPLADGCVQGTARDRGGQHDRVEAC